MCITSTKRIFVYFQTWMTFFADGDTMPPPLNIVVTPSDVIRFYHWCRGRMGKASPKEGTSRWSLPRCFYFEDKHRATKEQDDDAYELLMSRLIQRYFNSIKAGDSSAAQKPTKKSDPPSTAAVLEDIQTQLKELSAAVRQIEKR